MANPERGEIEIVVKRTENGAEIEKPYTLKLSMNAAVAIEARTKKKIGELLADATALDFTAIRDIVFALLQKYHAKEFKSLDSAGDLIDDAGGVHVFFESLQKLGEANAPEGGDKANPPTALVSGTGDGSTETAAASV